LPSNHLCKFLHYNTLKTSKTAHPLTIASTPVSVTLMQPLTASSCSSKRRRLISWRLESEMAKPQKLRRREWSCRKPREKTSIAVSERAQQNDYFNF
jgi:hypothetical protein